MIAQLHVNKKNIRVSMDYFTPAKHHNSFAVLNLQVGDDVIKIFMDSDHSFLNLFPPSDTEFKA